MISSYLILFLISCISALHFQLHSILHRPLPASRPPSSSSPFHHLLQFPYHPHPPIGGVYSLIFPPSILSNHSFSIPFPIQSRPRVSNTDPSSSPLFSQQVHSYANNQFLLSAHSFHAPWGLEPNVTDKDTILSLAKMTANAYTIPDNSDWEPIDHFFTNESFGWSNDGLRGYIYVTELKDIAIITIKGTSASFLGIGSDTARNDKLNDNRMFSCCCAHVDRTWFPVCDCFKGQSQCNWNCLRNATDFEQSYYVAGMDLYKAVSLLYPRAAIWFTGHSLGGSVAALLATHYQVPAVTFEAPGERLFAERLGLILPSQDTSYLPIYHFGHNADPIFIGRCRGPRSSCYFAGYAIETKCHIGNVCIYPVRQSLNDTQLNDDNDSSSTTYLNTKNNMTNMQDNETSISTLNKLWWWWSDGNIDSSTKINDGIDSSDNVNKPIETNPIPNPIPTGVVPPALQWGVDIRHHRIHEVIDYVINQWPTVPQCTPQTECHDCAGWKFV